MDIFYEEPDEMRRQATVQAYYYIALAGGTMVGCIMQFWATAQVQQPLLYILFLVGINIYGNCYSISTIAALINVAHTPYLLPS